MVFKGDARSSNYSSQDGLVSSDCCGSGLFGGTLVEELS